MSYAHLSDRFFTEKFPTADFLQSQREKEHWSRSCVPLGAWQGLVFVGFSDEHPPKLIESHYMFVRASAGMLEKVYTELKKEQPVDTDIMSLMHGQTVDTPLLADETTETRAAEPSVDLLDLNTGIDLKPTTLTATGGANSGISVAMKEPQTAVKDFSQVTKSFSKQIALANTTETDDWAAYALNEMKSHFQKAMIFFVHDNMATPSHWDSEFTHQGSSTNLIPLDSASPFRIVYRTQKPYHGYVVSNELNDQFFEEWTQGQTPDHMTLAPIVVGDEVLGLLMGIGEKASDNKVSLHFAEKLAHSLSTHFKSSSQAA